MYRTAVILRHTFREAIVQPIYSLLLVFGAAILIIFWLLPFFTLGEDTVMFKAVGLDVILLIVLIATLFATSKSIYEEIEDRTMLTLMSKPLYRWEVLVGKYLGIVLAALLAVVVLGAVMAMATYYRIPNDYLIRNTLDDREFARLQGYRAMHVLSLVPSLIQTWLMIAALAAVSVAISTRVSLVVNLPVVILIYIAGNLTRFIYPTGNIESPLLKAPAYAASKLLPYLETFDVRPLAIYKPLAVGIFANDVNAVPMSVIWTYLGLSTAYAICYATFALAVGMWLFQTRELGGAEG
ncbi:MAG TPA: ABC transporter permease subunit [Tepidisphaeraceae bacterium]|nr:ABC transporter permease subunit [Tepidisphaeraceae bacterium]